MRRKAWSSILTLIALALFAPSTNLQASPRIKVFKLVVTNQTGQARAHENIVVRVADLKRIAPDFKAGAIIVTTSSAATLDEDARTLDPVELPSQADDIDGDGKYDEIAFQIALGPNQSRIVTVAYGDAATLQRLRSDYPKRAQAKFTTKFEGKGWESELTAWRIYFDSRNAIDLYGKRRPGLYLEMFGSPEYDYHEESPYGRDIYKIGDALGIGSVGALVDGRVIKVADVAERRWRIIGNGPVRSIVELEYKGWKVGGRSVDLKSQIRQWAGERGFEHRVMVSSAEGLTLVTGLPRKPGIQMWPILHSSVSGIATWGHQVLKTGAAATESFTDQNLGLALIISNALSIEGDSANFLAPISLKNGAASWYVAAAWDQESSENLKVNADSAARRNQSGTSGFPSQAIIRREGFADFVKELSARIAQPAQVRVLSTQAAPESAPLDTPHPAKQKTYAEAIALIEQSVECTAKKWEPVISVTPIETVNKTNGLGFFTEGDNQTGELKEQKGYFRTGCFWVGQLRKLYARTKDERYRRWAELWHARLLGKEMMQNHDTGFLNYYTSVFAYGGLRARRVTLGGERWESVTRSNRQSGLFATTAR